VTRVIGPGHPHSDGDAGAGSIDPPGKCRRCGAFRYEARWCDLCGLDFRLEAPRPLDAASYAALQREQRWLSERSSPPISEADKRAPPPIPPGVSVVRFRDGSLVVPARVTTSDGTVGEGVRRIGRQHPQYNAWSAYCERHPEDVVDRRDQRRDTNEHLEAGLCSGVGFTAATFVFSAFRDEFDGVDPGTAVAAGVLIFTFWFFVGFVGSLWAAQREEASGAMIKRSAAEVEAPPH
jgi:hypothetical protein